MEFIDKDTGQVLTPDEVEFAYTREGRRVVGKEYPNPVPFEPPLGFVDHKPIHQLIREMVVNEVSRRAADEDMETMEEADDFDVGDDFDPVSPWEEQFEPDQAWPPSKEVSAAEQEIVAAQERMVELRRELAELEKVAPPQGARPEDAKPPSAGSESPPSPSK